MYIATCLALLNFVLMLKLSSFKIVSYSFFYIPTSAIVFTFYCILVVSREGSYCIAFLVGTLTDRNYLLLRCVSLYEPVKNDSRSLESWQSLLAKMRSLIMIAYNRALNRYVAIWC